MGLIAEVLQFFRGTDNDVPTPECQVDLGGNDILTAQIFAPIGHDAQPLPGDYVALMPGPEAGSFVILGYIDPKTIGTTRPGEVCHYLRDADGNVQGEFYLASSEPAWKAAEGALIARADRVEAEIKVIRDALAQPTATGLDPGDCGALYRTNINTALGEQGTVGCDKGYIT